MASPDASHAASLDTSHAISRTVLEACIASTRARSHDISTQDEKQYQPIPQAVALCQTPSELFEIYRRGLSVLNELKRKELEQMKYLNDTISWNAHVCGRGEIDPSDLETMQDLVLENQKLMDEIFKSNTHKTKMTRFIRRNSDITATQATQAESDDDDMYG
uniref:Uncharacterized protein n=1 Tax=Megaviridae environmental sample TaxID=1737588 RepID=A0A5J6VIV4_9VIRU|nr:MAG: hypothetical protein [Megaviridae environmental sample]